MIAMMCLALANGICIGLSRSLNGQLSLSKGVLQATFMNHIIGFILLSVLLFSIGVTPHSLSTHFNWQTSFFYLGGFIGGGYVAINAYILARLGSMKATLFVISGQMVTGFILDSLLNSAATSSLTHLWQGVGLVCILLGVGLAQKSPKTRS